MTPQLLWNYNIKKLWEYPENTGISLLSLTFWFVKHIILTIVGDSTRNQDKCDNNKLPEDSHGEKSLFFFLYSDSK